MNQPGGGNKIHTSLTQKRKLVRIATGSRSAAHRPNGVRAMLTIVGMKVNISSWKLRVKSNSSPYWGPNRLSAVMFWGAIGHHQTLSEAATDQVEKLHWSS